MTAEDVAVVAEPVPLRHNRDFNLLWSGQAVSALGSRISEIAFPLLILAVTGSAAKAGLVGTSVLIANLVTLLPAGVVGDHYPRRRIMVICSLVQMVAVGTVVPAVLTGHVVLGWLVTVGAVQGVASAFYMGASRGALRRVVPRPQLGQALSRAQARDQTAFLMGPPIGGALFSAARFLPFACDALSFGAITLAAVLVRGSMDPVPGTVAPREPLRRDVTKGIRYVLRNSYLRTVAMWAAANNGIATGIVLMIVVLVRYRGGSPEVVGLVSATGPVGGLLGALLGPRLIRAVPGRRLVVVSSWLMVLCPVGMALAPSVGLIGVTAALSMFVTMPVNVVLLTRATELTSHDMQAQTGNAMLLLGSSIRWLAPFTFGLLADLWGPVTTTLVAAALYVVTAAWLQRQPALHQLDGPAPEAP